MDNFYDRIHCNKIDLWSIGLHVREATNRMFHVCAPMGCEDARQSPVACSLVALASFKVYGLVLTHDGDIFTCLCLNCRRMVLRVVSPVLCSCAPCQVDDVRDTFRSILQMSLVMTYGGSVPVIKVSAWTISGRTQDADEQHKLGCHRALFSATRSAWDCRASLPRNGSH